MITLILPLPPSANDLQMPVRTRTGARIANSPEYREWKPNAKRHVEMQREGARITGPFRVSILLPEGRNDGDNLIKPLLDACQHGGAISNDRNCRGGTWDVDDTREGTALIELTPLNQPTSAGIRSASARRSRSG